MKKAQTVQPRTVQPQTVQHSAGILPLFGRRVALLFAMAVTASLALAAPDSRTETYADWTVRCVSRQGVPPCDIVQYAMRESGERVMEFSLAYDGGAQDIYAIQIRLPLGVALQGGVLIRVDEKTDIQDFVFSRCDVSACYIEKITDFEGLDPFIIGSKGALITIHHATQAPQIMPLSFTGFNDALAFMTEHNKHWAEQNAEQNAEEDRAE